MGISIETIERLKTKLRDVPPKAAKTVGSNKEAVLMLRAEIERLRANGHDWNDVAELLKDDGQGSGIAIKGATIKAALAAFRTGQPKRTRKPSSSTNDTGHIAGL